MRVTGYKREAVEIEVNEADILIDIRKRWIATQRGEWISNGRWISLAHTSHSWDDDKGEATDEQIKIYEAFATIQNVLRDLK